MIIERGGNKWELENFGNDVNEVQITKNSNLLVETASGKIYFKSNQMLISDLDVIVYMLGEYRDKINKRI